MKNISYQARLDQSEQISPDTYIISLYCPELIGKFKAGQFMEIDCGGFLYRPFALMEEDLCKNHLKIGVKAIGENTRRLVSFPIGTELTILGPLGKGFDLNAYDKVWAVGGGSGIFPLKMALQEAEQQGKDTCLVCGFRSEEEAFPRSLFAEVCDLLVYSSDRGGLDFHGHAGDCFSAFYKPSPNPQKEVILACGPIPLMKYLQGFAVERGIDCQISLEENMACGLGLCSGCAVDVKNSKGEIERLRCCHEGPVFNAKDLIFE